MLVLTRKENEVIRINDDISVTIVKIEHGKVKIGIEAPARKQQIEIIADHGDDPGDTTFEVPPVSDMTRDELREYANHLLRIAEGS